jgi:hypothetical protein
MGWREDKTFTPGKRLDEPNIDLTAEHTDISDLEPDTDSCIETLREDGRVATIALGFAGLSAVSLAVLYRAHKKKGE